MDPMTTTTTPAARRRHILWAVVTALLLATPVSTALVGDLTPERPDRHACDEDEPLIVCAGASSGANVQCNESPTPEGRCTWTVGWIFDGFSQLGLPGEADFSWSGTVSICVSGHPCEASSLATGQETCAWLPAAECILSVRGPDGDTGFVELPMGACLTVTVTPTASSEAWSMERDGALALGHASITDSTPDSGQVCNFDNGRPT